MRWKELVQFGKSWLAKFIDKEGVNDAYRS